MTEGEVQGLPFTPVVIIGAGRSGTNALRDALTRLPQFATWPCDEINPIWRHGNLSHPHDEIPSNRATPKVRKFIRNAFTRIWHQQGKPAFVVEKTCANSLRVPFVDAVLPEARYIQIVRDGFDVVASARKRWQGELEIPGLPYFLAKARFAPRVDLPLYGVSFLRGRFDLLFNKEKHLNSWGPRFEGMDGMKMASLEERCVAQWAACVTKSDQAFTRMRPEKVLSIRYEDFTADPTGVLTIILKFLGTSSPVEQIAQAAEPIRRTSVGKGQDMADILTPSALELVKATMRKHELRG